MQGHVQCIHFELRLEISLGRTAYIITCAGRLPPTQVMSGRRSMLAAELAELANPAPVKGGMRACLAEFIEQYTCTAGSALATACDLGPTLRMRRARPGCQRLRRRRRAPGHRLRAGVGPALQVRPPARRGRAPGAATRRTSSQRRGPRTCSLLQRPDGLSAAWPRSAAPRRSARGCAAPLR